MGKKKSYRERGQLTIAELIRKLQQYPEDLLVWHEGCDCTGAANGVEYDPIDNSVLITRIK